MFRAGPAMRTSTAPSRAALVDYPWSLVTWDSVSRAPQRCTTRLHHRTVLRRRSESECSLGFLMRIGVNYVGCLFRDHVNRCDDEKSRNPWENRGVNDPQPLGPIDSEITVEHRHRILPCADLASAGCVVAPGIVFHELGQALSLIGIGRLLFIEDIRDLRVNRADKFDSIDDRVDILLPVAGSFVEVAEIDFGRIARIG